MQRTEQGTERRTDVIGTERFVGRSGGQSDAGHKTELGVSEWKDRNVKKQEVEGRNKGREKKSRRGLRTSKDWESDTFPL